MEIRHKTTGEILFKDDSPTVKETLENAGRIFRETVKSAVQVGRDKNRQTVWNIDKDLLKTAPDLSGADLKGSDLSGMVLWGVEIGFVNPDTDDRSSREYDFPLAEADFSSCNLVGVEFYRVNTSGAVYQNAILENPSEDDEEDHEFGP